MFSRAIMENMKSISLPRMAVGVVTFSLLFAGCKQVTDKVAQTAQEMAQQAQTAILTEAQLSGIKDPLVRKHLVAQANTRSYRVTSKSSGRGEPVTVTEIQMAGNEVKFHTVTQTNSKTSQEMILIGDTTYIKDFSDGKWWKQVAKTDDKSEDKAPFEMPDLNELKEEFTKKQQESEFKSLGTEGCGSLTCYKYQEVESENKEATRTFWFDNKDFLLRKEENKFGEFTSTNEYSYDNINIQAPSPTKDVPAGKNIYEMMIPGAAAAGSRSTGSSGNSVPTQEEINKLMEQYSQEQSEE